MFNLEFIYDMRKQEPPPPWRLVASRTVAALCDVGYAPDSDLLLVLSNSGRGVFDCLTGELLARDQSEIWDRVEFDFTKLTARGIGPLQDVRIRTAGQHGGGLPIYTTD